MRSRKHYIVCTPDGSRGQALHPPSPIRLRQSAFANPPSPRLRRKWASVGKLCNPRRRSAAGLTLIEILIAMFIFLIGVLGILAVFPVAMNSAGRTIGETRSNVLAQTVLAQVSADWKSPYYTGMVVAPVLNAGTLTVTGTVPSNLVGCFVTVTGAPTCNNDPAIGQSRIITAINPNATNSANTDLLVCPDLNPPPLVPPLPAGDTDTTEPAIIITKLALPSFPVYQLSSTLTLSGATITSTPPIWRSGQWDGYYVVFTKVASRNWIGISRQIVSTVIQPGSPPTSVLNLDPTQQPVDTTAVGNGDQFAIVDGGYYVMGSGLPQTKSRSGYVMQIGMSVTPNDSINVGRLDPNDPAGQHVTALSWCPSGYNPPVNTFGLWFKPDAYTPTPYPATATGGSASTLIDTNANWQQSAAGPTSNYGPPSDLRGCMAIIVGDGNNGAFSLANQARLITSNTATQLTVFPNWTIPGSLPTGWTWKNIQFVIREQPGNYFLVINSGKAAGRVLPITGYTVGVHIPKYPLGTGFYSADQITCAGVDFGSLGVKMAYNGGAAAPNDYVARNADTFTIIGVNGYPNSAYVAYSSPVDAAHVPAPPYQNATVVAVSGNAVNLTLTGTTGMQASGGNIQLMGFTPAGFNGTYPFVGAAAPNQVTVVTNNPPALSSNGLYCFLQPYQLNSFGYPGIADRQTRSDVQTLMSNAPEAQTSDYNYACIFSGNGPLPTGPARADIFVFRNFNSALPVVNNLKPVGYMAGYIKRP